MFVIDFGNTGAFEWIILSNSSRSVMIFLFLGFGVGIRRVVSESLIMFGECLLVSSYPNLSGSGKNSQLMTD